MTDQNELNRQDTTAPDDGAVVMEEVMPEEKVDFPPEEDLFDREEPGQDGLPLPEKEPAEMPSSFSISKYFVFIRIISKHHPFAGRPDHRDPSRQADRRRRRERRRPV